MSELFNTLIYENNLSCPDDVKDFVLEGSADISFADGRMNLSSNLDPALGQKANYVFWCNEDFPENIKITWDFYPKAPVGLCMMFFAAKGINGEDLFDESLKKREGQYGQYTHSDINAFHVSYFRTNFRTNASEPALRTCNLRKSKGFYLVAQGGDPIPELEFCKPPYHICIIKNENIIRFMINDILLFEYVDDGIKHGPLLGNGKIGFRQMSPMVAQYTNLKVFTK